MLCVVFVYHCTISNKKNHTAFRNDAKYAIVGFRKTWTIAIGIAEIMGVLLIIAGLYKSQLRTLGILLLFPFAIGAFTAHMAHQEYFHFYNSLIMCFLSFILLCFDERININLSPIVKEVK